MEHNAPNQPQPQPQVVQPPQLAQAPAPDTNSFQEQPKVQYVVMQKSLEGLGGWLAVFMGLFALMGIGYISMTFDTPASIKTFTSPVMAIALIACVVLIALRKKIALWVIYGTLLVSFLVGVINLVTEGDKEPAKLVGSILVGLVFYSLFGLYFFVSKRVKATLTK